MQLSTNMPGASESIIRAEEWAGPSGRQQSTWDAPCRVLLAVEKSTSVEIARCRVVCRLRLCMPYSIQEERALDRRGNRVDHLQSPAVQ